MLYLRFAYIYQTLLLLWSSLNVESSNFPLIESDKIYSFIPNHTHGRNRRILAPFTMIVVALKGNGPTAAIMCQFWRYNNLFFTKYWQIIERNWTKIKWFEGKFLLIVHFYFMICSMPYNTERQGSDKSMTFPSF